MFTQTIQATPDTITNFFYKFQNYLLKKFKKIVSSSPPPSINPALGTQESSAGNGTSYYYTMKTRCFFFLFCFLCFFITGSPRLIISIVSGVAPSYTDKQSGRSGSDLHGIRIPPAEAFYNNASGHFFFFFC